MRTGQTILVKQNADNSELQRAIEAVIPAATKQAASIANRYKGKNEAETCKKIFNYLKNNINYKADGVNQAVRLPSGLMRTAQGDCKSYSVFTSAILSNLGIPHKLVYASYDPKDPTPTHIYVMTNNGCIIDAVYGKFNAEKKANYKKYKDMNISYISGTKRRIGSDVDTKQFPFHLYITKDGKPFRVDSYRTRSAADKVRKMLRPDVNPRISQKFIGNMGKYGTGGACGIGAVEGAFEWATRNGINLSASQKIAIAAQKVLPLAIGGRAFVRNLIQKNAGGFATSLNKLMVESRSQRAGRPAWDKMRSIELQWLNKGGNPNELYESIAEGASKTPTGAYFNKLLKMKASGYNPNIAQWIAAAVSAVFGKKYNPTTGAITGEPATTTAVAVSTAPWWGAMIGSIITTLGLAYITGSAAAAPGEDITTDTTSTTTTTTTSTGSTILPIILIGGAAAAAYFYFNKKK